MTSSALPGGDDVNAIVLDIGAHTFRGGFAGEDVPRVVESSAWMTFPQNSEDVKMDSNNITSSNMRPVNYAMHMPPLDISLRSALSPDSKTGIIGLNETIFESIVKHSFKNPRRTLDVDFSETPLIMTEPNRRGDNRFRKVCLESGLETFNFPAMSMIPRASSAAFAVGKPSGLVVDLGASMTSICPVYDGFVLQQSLMEFPNIGGDLLDTILHEVLKKKKINVGHFRQYDNVQQLSEQYLHGSRLAAIREMKHEMCKLSSTPLTGLAGYNNWSMTAHLTPTHSPVVLPDGTTVDIGNISHMIPELLFDPSPLSVIPTLSNVANSYPGITSAIMDVLSNCDVDARKSVSSDIILTGGSSLFEGMPDRLLKALSGGPLPKCKVTATPVAIDRIYASWLGCSILASCASFQQLWISKAQYEEEGFDRVVAKQLFW